MSVYYGIEVNKKMTKDEELAPIVAGSVKTLVIMRGLPGSGKSTAAAKIQPNDRYRCSADDYHTGVDGVYRWKPENVHAAHTYCQSKARKLMNTGVPLVVIDNTNTKLRDFKIYLDMAAEFGYKVKYGYSDTAWAWDVEECAKRNTHSVPLDTIRRMYTQYESL